MLSSFTACVSPSLPDLAIAESSEAMLSERSARRFEAVVVLEFVELTVIAS